MAGKFLISIDLINLPTSDNSIDLQDISFFNRVYVSVNPETLEDASAFLKENLHHFTVFCDCTALNTVESIVALLDQGATKVFLSSRQFSDITQNKLYQSQDLGRLVNLEEQGATDHYVTLKDNFLEDYIKTVKAGRTAIISAKELTTDLAKHPNLMPASFLITSILRSDRPDGLFPTVVSDERGICLGLVYSNEQSIEVALQKRRGVYHSRSRKDLWIKGEESGDTQELISIDWDCDVDALLFKVKQNGEGRSPLHKNLAFSYVA